MRVFENKSISYEIKRQGLTTMNPDLQETSTIVASQEGTRQISSRNTGAGVLHIALEDY